MSTPIIYRSSDASAPVLSGTVGALTALLDACLVNGYGSKSAAGWTIAWTATNKRSYLMPAGNAFSLDVDDSGPGTGGAQEAIVRGWEVETAVETGTNPFPTVAQIAANVPNWRKSSAASSAPRGWILIADDRSFILGILDGDVASAYKVYYFGDIYSLKSGDGYRTIISVRTTANSAAAAGSLGSGAGANSGFATAGLYAARIAAATGTSVNITEIWSGTTIESTASFLQSLDGKIYISRILIGETTGVHPRGWLRGVYGVSNPVGLNDGDTFTGSGDFAGRSFVILKNPVGVVGGAFALETTAWDTSS